MTITLPVRKEIYPRDNCKECNVKLDSSNRYINEGRTDRMCKKCLSLRSKKYYAKRKKAMQQNKWF